MKNIVSVVLIGSTPKPRTYKRLNLLNKISKVNLLCWDRMNESQLKVEQNVDYPVYVQHIKAKNDPLKRAVPYMRFFKKALMQLNEIQPDLIHVEGLDMLKIADRYKSRSKKKVVIIYEVPDLRRLITEKQKGFIKKIGKIYVCNQEKKLCARIDLMTITSEMFYEKHYKGIVGKEKIIYIPNIPEYKAFKEYKKYDGANGFVVGWIGSIRYKQQMKMMLNVTNETQCKVLVAGYENKPAVIEPICRGRDNVEWIGMYDYDRDIASLYGKCSVIFAVYDASMINEQIALPNKLYEAVYCELPIIVSKGTYLAKVVEEWGVGVAVDCNNQTELINALEEMKNNRQLYETYVNKCRENKKNINLIKYNHILIEEICRVLEL